MLYGYLKILKDWHWHLSNLRNPGKALLHVSLSDPRPWQVSLVVAGGLLTKLAAPPRPHSPSCVYILYRQHHFLITTGQHTHTTIPSQAVSSQLIRYIWNSAMNSNFYVERTLKNWYISFIQKASAFNWITTPEQKEASSVVFVVYSEGCSIIINIQIT